MLVDLKAGMRAAKKVEQKVEDWVATLVGMMALTSLAYWSVWMLAGGKAALKVEMWVGRWEPKALRSVGRTAGLLVSL